jgi:ribonuclease Z
VIAGNDLFVIDAGSRAAGTLGATGLPVGQIRAIFLTHFHSDHIDGLGELMMNRWVMGANETPVPVYGPQGVERVLAGLKEAYALDTGYRIAHHGEDVAPPSGAGGTPIALDLPEEPGARTVVLEKGDLKVIAFNVDHAPIHPAVAYRFEYKGRSVVISGDTAPSEEVVEHAQGVDVLVHEALQREMVMAMHEEARTGGMDKRAKILRDIQDNHTSPQEAAEIAQKAGAKYLLLYHVVPPIPPFMARVYLGNADTAFDGTIHLGQDGDLLSLPAGSTQISSTHLL